MLKKNTQISEAFQVDNSIAGRRTIATIKALFARTDYKVIVRGRDADRKKQVTKAGLKYNGTHKQDISVYLARRLSVYIVHKTTGQHLFGPASTFSYDADKVALKAENERLQSRVKELEASIRNIAAITALSN